jgi:hypothetical protein
MSTTTRGIKQRTVAGVALLLLGLASMFLGFASTNASAAAPVTCNSSGFTKGANEDKSSGSGTYAFGTLSWSGSTLIYNVSAGYTVQLCVKAGSTRSVPAGPLATTTVVGPAQGTLTTNGGKGISHVGYKFSSTPTTPTTPVSTPTTPVSTPTTPVSTPIETLPTEETTPIETLPTEETTPIETLPTEETTPIETLPTEGTAPGGPNNPGNPNKPAEGEPEVLGIEQNAPAAAPTAVDAGLSGAESGSSSTLWILAGAALALAGLVMGFVPVAPRGKREL